MSDQSAYGSCHCGAVRYSVTGNVEGFICHCTNCRLNSGAPYTAWGKVHQDSFQLLSGTLNEYQSREGVFWSFCKVCGTSIKYQNVDSAPYIDFTLATLESASKIAPSYHVQIQEKLSWVEIGDGLPQYKIWRTDVT